MSAAQELTLARLKRPPSYSDSYYILNGHHTPTPTPLTDARQPEQAIAPATQPPVAPRIHLFFIKSAIHLFLISLFETVFFFQYVSVTENNGILTTLNTYYKPFLNTCPSWSNTTKEVLLEFLQQGNTYEMIVLKGDEGLAQRQDANRTLLEKSLAASGFCLVIVVLGTMYLKYKDTPVRWHVVYLENLSMVVLLGLYEFIFFRLIIYNYGTLSTPELNEYLVKGVYDCIGGDEGGVGRWPKG